MLKEGAQLDKHIFHKFDDELSGLISQFLEMGGLVEKQLADALVALESPDSEMASAVIANESQVNEFDVEIDKACVRIIATRQPTASDLRLILGIGKSVQDLERIGDEANKIAKMALKLMEQDAGTVGYVEIRHVAGLVTAMLSNVLNAYGRMDAEDSLNIAKQDKLVDQEYGSALRELVTYMMEDPRSISKVLNIIWALRSLERIGDHVKNLSEQLIYTVSGVDVRHSSFKEMEEQVQDNN
jgi:phosphate transport system protein